MSAPRMEIVQGPEVAAFVAKGCGDPDEMFAEPYRAIGFTFDGVMAGGAVFNGYEGRNINLTVANSIQRWPMPFIRFFSDYIWNTLKVERVSMVVRPENSPMCERIGGRMEGVLRRWYPDCDGVLFGCIKEEWKLPTL